MGRSDVQVPRPGEIVVWEGRSCPGLDMSTWEVAIAFVAMACVLAGFSQAYDGNLALGVPLLVFGGYWYPVQYVLDPSHRAAPGPKPLGPA